MWCSSWLLCACVCVHAHVCMCVCVCAFMYACVHACVCMCAFVREKGASVFLAKNISVFCSDLPQILYNCSFIFIRSGNI